MQVRRDEIQGDLGRLMERVPNRAADLANRYPRWAVAVVGQVNEGLEVGRDDGAVHAGLRRQPLGFAAIERHPEQLPLHRRVLPGEKI